MDSISVEVITLVVTLTIFDFVKGIFKKGFIEPLQYYLFQRLFNRGGLSFEEIERMVVDDCREIDDRIRGYFGNAFGIASGIIAHRNLSPEDEKRYRELLDKTYSVTKLLDDGD